MNPNKQLILELKSEIEDLKNQKYEIQNSLFDISGELKGIAQLVNGLANMQDLEQELFSHTCWALRGNIEYLCKRIDELS